MFCSWSKSPVKSVNQYFNTHQNRIYVNEQHSSYRVNCFSPKIVTQVYVHSQEIDTLNNEHLNLDHLRFHVIDMGLLVLDIAIVIENSFPIEVHHVQDALNFFNQWRKSRYSHLFYLRKDRNHCFCGSSSRNLEYFKKYNSLCRLPSRPHWRPASASRRFVNLLQSNSSETPNQYAENVSK